MISSQTSIPGVFVFERQNIGDTRGHLSRLFCASTLQAAGWMKPISQVNHTVTTSAGCVRGLHFQNPPHSEMKLVNCLRGAVWDVAVDLRRGSPTFLRWHAEKLSEENRLALLIPEGCAHGFQALTDNCELLYCTSAKYVRESEGGVRYDDPSLSICWPLPIRNVSAKDMKIPLLAANFIGLSVCSVAQDSPE